MNVSLPIAEIRRCASDPEFVSAVADVFAETDAIIAAHSPVCTNRGLCCHFDAYDHRLYVTSTELAYFLSGFSDDLTAPENDGYCPYQVGGRCTAREHRPLGCRVFFCDPNSQSWQPGLTESMLVRLRAIGRAHDLPDAYADWTASLRALGGQMVHQAGPQTHTAGVSLSIDTPSMRS